MSILRGVAIALVIGMTATGFIIGSLSDTANYNPHTFAVGVSAMLLFACLAIAVLGYRLRRARNAWREIAARNRALTDRNWDLKDAEERARNLIDSQGDLIVRRDGDGRITFANDAFCRIAQRSRADILGADFRLEIRQEGDVGVLEDGSRVYDQKIATSVGERWIAWREQIVRIEPDEPAEIQAVGRDVTDRVLAERALAEARDQAAAASLAKSRFLAMVSHEIRTPLNGILGMAGLIADTPLSAEQATYVRAIKTSGDALLSLIEEILDLSKIESGKIDLDAKPLALAALVEDVAELLAPRAQARGIDIAVSVDERLPAQVVGDESRLRQILLNLAGNAIKFTSQGGVAIFVEPGIWPDDVMLRVEDTGIGIAPDAIERIFKEFEQEDSGTARKFGGTGLGLAITRRIVERMGGRIGVDSAPGRGARFEVTVRLPAHVDRTPVLTPPDLAGRAMLIVAPASFETDILASYLGRWGAQLCIVTDDAVACALLPEREWDTMIVDERIGQSAAMALAGQATPHCDRRIVLTRPAMRPELPALRAAGFTDYLLKPLRAASLAARIDADWKAMSAHDSTAASRPDETTEDRVWGDDVRGMRRGLDVLVAEDNDINALLVRALLGKLGHRPVIAENGRAAVESFMAAQAAGAPYDVVLMDVQMPDLDGLAATRAIRTHEAANDAPRTLILALTANTLGEDRNACMAAGMDGFIAKPLDKGQLQSVFAAIKPRAHLAA